LKGNIFMSQLRFKNYGGSYQLKIQAEQDLEKVHYLDEVYWAATSIPINSLNCDQVFTSYIDTDKNGRIRPNEFKAAISWLFQLLVERGSLSLGTENLKLSDIDTSHAEGQKLLATAKIILTNLNISDAQAITLTQIRDVQSIMARAANNGDGIITPDESYAADLNQFITSVMEIIGFTLDAGGKQGISQEQLEEYFNQTETYLEWKAKGEKMLGKDSTNIMPWGKDTPQAYELMTNLEEKLEQFYLQCSMIKFDERTAIQMQFRQQELEEIDFKDKLILETRLKSGPLALPNSEGILNLKENVNPLYIDHLLEFQKKVLNHVLGDSVKQLTEKDWNKVKDIFIPYQDWFKNKPLTKVEQLETNVLRSYLDGAFKEQVSRLITKDLAVAGDLNQIHDLEKLVLYQRWLMDLANNFVSFANIYDPKRHSLFEMGTLIIEGREITFTLKVADCQAHKSIAKSSNMYLLYVEVTGRQDKDIKFEIVASVTSGNANGLRVGKRGIFITLDGLEMDAKVVDIIVNPISLWESVKAPFQQFVDYIKKQIDKFTKSSQSKVSENTSSSDPTGIGRNFLLAGGVAIAALGSALAYIIKSLSQVKPTHVLLAILGVITLILLPGIITGFIKIRKRNMSVILEASGWAVNAHMRLNTTLGRLFTNIPRLPKNARKERRDVVAQFAKQIGYASFRSKGIVILSLITIIIVSCLITAWFAYPELRLLFVK
jgi:hypothetical protein